MPTVSTGTTSINFGSALRIGWRPQGSLTPFTYLLPYPTADDLPNYHFTVPVTGAVEIEYTEICPNCSGNTYSTPTVVNLNLT